MPTVFVVSRDGCGHHFEPASYCLTLRAAVRAELREAGVDALGLETADDVGRALARGVWPSLIVIDGAELASPAARQAMSNLARQTVVLVIDSPTAPAPDLPGAERLARPLRVGDIVKRVLARLAEQAPEENAARNNS